MSVSKLLPTHIAIIMDGNGRWAKNRLLPRVVGHKEGAKTVREITTYSAKIGIKYLTLFAFSTENFLRPKDEVSFLMKMFYDYLHSEYETIMSNNISFTVSGRVDKLSNEINELIEKLKKDSAKNNGMVLNIAISYGGKEEITDICKEIAKAVKSGKISINDIDEELLSDYQYNPQIPDIDLLIRTSGECRISNFMLYRLAYSELYFTKRLWPDFTGSDLDTAIEEFATRVRRYGKTDEQL